MASTPTPFVILTGAGISADSRVPTFRGRDGFWNTYRVEELATPQAFNNDPDLVWSFYHWRRERIRSCQPNPAHETVAAIQQTHSAITIITQNVDGLHQAAGSVNTLELHGSLWRMRCCICGNRWEDRKSRTSIPSYPFCGGRARPDVVWFGETLDATLLQAAVEASISAACMLIIGTSGLVYPAASLPGEAQRAGATLIEFNREETTLTPGVDIHIAGRAAETLPRWWAQQRQHQSVSLDEG